MLADQFERQRFIQEIQNNFSVLAPAGVGKTQAIVERLIQVAKGWGNAPQGKIAIVTYTQKAAKEMQERVEAALKSLPDHGRHFKSVAFFGTIHSLALMLLEQYGSVCGLPLQLELLEDPHSTWESFCIELSQESIIKKISFWEEAAPLISIREALKHCESSSIHLPPPPPIIEAPKIDWQALDRWVPEKPALKRGVDATLQELKTFGQAYEKRLPLLTLPIPTKGGESFIQAVEELLKPLRDFIANAWHHLLYQLQTQYQSYRHERGQLTYDDMIHLALKIVQSPEIQKANFHVLLDEAQDTDTEQLLFLQKLAGLTELTDDYPHLNNCRLVLVGDPQQSIYGMRAHLSTYLKLHENLVKKNLAEELRFSVTFRCDTLLIDTFNALGGHLLKPSKHHKELQVPFQPLKARPNATLGHIERLALDADSSIEDPEVYEANAIAQFLQKTKLRTTPNLSSIAILCPRNEWLQTIAEALQRHALPYQLHARGKIHREMAAFSWTLALLKAFYQPQEPFETVGLLREVFGISDALLAEWVELASRNPSYTLHPLSFLNQFHPLDFTEKFLPLYHALELLKEAQAASLKLGPRATLEVIYEMLNFRERLEALSHLNIIEELELLQNLLTEASSYECEGKSTYDWLKALEIRKNKPLEMQAVEENKIQLLSSHSAKGLEWETVILPYFFRPIGYKVQSYPQWLSFGSTYGFRWDSAHHLHPLGSWVTEDRKAQQERLLYVTLTRAKHELYIVEDVNLWKKTSSSFAETLHIQPGEASHAIWEKIPQTKLDTELSFSSEIKKEAQLSKNFIKLNPKTWSNYPERKLPSQAEPHENLTFILNTAKSTSGTEYGNTWHEMMASCPWQEGYTAWEAHCKNWSSRFFDLKRAKEEIDIFLQSEIISLLQEFAPYIRTEVPFIWQESDTTLYEGSIDLLAYDPMRQEGWILDWKTNRSKSINDLRKIYIHQLTTYQAALKSRYQDSIIKKILYGTEPGEFLIENEL